MSLAVVTRSPRACSGLAYSGVVVGAEQLGDAEIEESRRAVLGDQDVARLQIAVDDEVAVRVMHGIADAPEQGQARLHGQGVALAVLVDGHALDEIHHQVRLAAVGGAGVDQPGDVGVIEAGEDLPLTGEAGVQDVAIEGRAQHLDGDRLAVLIVDADPEVDRAHAAAPDFADDFVGADPAADHRFRTVRQGHGVRAAVQECTGGVVRRQQALDGAA